MQLSYNLPDDFCHATRNNAAQGTHFNGYQQPTNTGLGYPSLETLGSFNRNLKRWNDPVNLASQTQQTFTHHHQVEA